MVLSGVMVDLVDWHGGVCDVWLDGLLLHHWLNSLVDMVVDVLASNDRGDAAGLLAADASGGVLVLGTLLGEAALVLLGVVMVDLAVLDWDNVVVVGLWEDLLVVDWLQ